MPVPPLDIELEDMSTGRMEGKKLYKIPERLGILEQNVIQLEKCKLVYKRNADVH